MNRYLSCLLIVMALGVSTPLSVAQMYPEVPSPKPFELALPTIEFSVPGEGPSRVFTPGAQLGINIHRFQLNLRGAIQGKHNTKVSLGIAGRYHLKNNGLPGWIPYGVILAGGTDEGRFESRWGLGFGLLKRTHNRSVINAQSNTLNQSKTSKTRDYYGNFRLELVPFIRSQSLGFLVTVSFGVDIGLPAPKPKKAEGDS